MVISSAFPVDILIGLIKKSFNLQQWPDKTRIPGIRILQGSHTYTPVFNNEQLIVIPTIDL